MAEQDQTQALAPMSAYEQLELAQQQLAQLDKLGENYVTNGQFPKSSDSRHDVIDLFSISSKKSLARLAGRMALGAQEYAAGIEVCGLENADMPIFKWGKYTVTDWQKDFQTRIAIIDAHKRREELTEFIREIKGYIGKEDALQRGMNLLGLMKK